MARSFTPTTYEDLDPDRRPSLAAALDRDLHVVHVTPDGESKGADGTESNALIDAEEAAEAVTGEFTAVELVGEPSERIIEYAKEHDASYVVVSGRKRSPVGKVLFGSVTQAILLNGDRPVLATMSDE